MFSKLKQFASEGITYGVANIVSRFLNILLVPIYTRMFLPHDYGIISLLNSTYNLIALLMIMGLDSAMMLYYHDYKDEGCKKPISVRVWAQTAITLVTCIILLPLSDSFSQLITKEQGHSYLFLFSTLNLIFTILPFTLIGWYRLKRNAKATVFFTIGSSVLTISLNILFVVVLKHGLNGIFFSTLLSSLIQSLVALFILKDWISIRYFEWPLYKRMFHYAFPLIPSAFAFWIVNSSASYFIDHYLSKTEVGIYQIASSLASVMLMVTGAFQMAWGPFAYSIKSENDAHDTYNKVFILYALVTGVLTVSISAFAKDVLQIFTTPAYVPAFIIGAILSFNYVITGYGYIASLGLNIAKTNWPVAKSIIASSLITLLLFYLLIPRLKAEGAALAVTIGQCAVPLYCFFIAQKVYPISYNFQKVIKLLLITVLASGLVLYINLHWESGIFLNALYVLLFVAVITALNHKTAFEIYKVLKAKFA